MSNKNLKVVIDTSRRSLKSQMKEANKLNAAYAIIIGDEEIKNQVNKSVKFAEESPYPSKKDVYKYIYTQEKYPFVVG